MSRHATDILILGGGVIGLTTAWYLADDPSPPRILVADRGDIGRAASWAGAGILPDASPLHASTPFDVLRAESRRLYPELSQQLRELTGVDNGYLACGGLELPDPDSPGEALPTHEWHSPGTTYAVLDGEYLRGRDPRLSRDVNHGVWLPGVAQVRNPWHLKALRLGCERRGVTLRSGVGAARIDVVGGRVRGATMDDGSAVAADRVLVATGAWAEGLLTPLGFRPGMVPVRGQMVLFDTGRAAVEPVRMVGKRYLVTRGDGKVLAGSTEELAGFDAVNTDEGVAGLVSFARRYLPELSRHEPAATWAGLRPAARDGLPILGAVPGVEGLYVACGHFRSGLQLSPGTGRWTADAMRGGEMPEAMAALGIDREGLRGPGGS